ncbi:hypothetical protein OSB04_015509 [Centaurea solstitialis]|uniref:Uncharacterized protein n=1 Tax=Centaurea solstitialis TaxID=347529 RepID=A0AA38WIU1_9ASTR|nr:hypothetical protein OSB04_015509 [Centaurea solstitialis]
MRPVVDDLERWRLTKEESETKFRHFLQTRLHRMMVLTGSLERTSIVNSAGDIYGHKNPECGPLKYFMVLVSTRWTHVVLLSTLIVALLALVVRLRAHHPDYLINPLLANQYHAYQLYMCQLRPTSAPKWVIKNNEVSMLVMDFQQLSAI